MNARLWCLTCESAPVDASGCEFETTLRDGAMPEPPERFACGCPPPGQRWRLRADSGEIYGLKAVFFGPPHSEGYTWAWDLPESIEAEATPTP